ncbi:MAG: hypothetical protein ABGX16_16140 [Pirellulales bacterium]
MRSSISSSKSEIKVLAVLLCVLLAAEVSMRIFGPAFSLELRRTHEIPVNARTMAAAEGMRFVVLGNSLTNAGFDAAAFTKELAQSGVTPVHIQVRHFPGSGSCEWFHIFKHFFVDTARLPDVLILPFNITSVQDDFPVTIGRLVNFCDVNDIPGVLFNDFHDFGDRTEFLHAYASTSFANRDKVRQAVFDILIPHYHSGETAIHTASTTPIPDETSSLVAGSYQQLERLMLLARSHGVIVIAVPMPASQPYSIDAELIGIIQSTGSLYADARMEAGLTLDEFRDGIHMNRRGAGLFSRALARHLQAKLPHDVE